MAVPEQDRYVITRKVRDGEIRESLAIQVRCRD